MNSDSITRNGEELLVQTEVPSLGGILTLPAMLYAQLKIAQRVEREAMRLYVMSDSELAARGHSREDIREHLLEAYDD